jgi:hypothetical protein
MANENPESDEAFYANLGYPADFNYPADYAPEEVLRLFIRDMKRLRNTIEGSARILSVEKFPESEPNTIKWIQRSSTLMGKLMDAADVYLQDRQQKS